VIETVGVAEFVGVFVGVILIVGVFVGDMLIVGVFVGDILMVGVFVGDILMVGVFVGDMLGVGVGGISSDIKEAIQDPVDAPTTIHVDVVLFHAQCKLSPGLV
jgi:hypothetical protein